MFDVGLVFRMGIGIKVLGWWVQRVTKETVAVVGGEGEERRWRRQWGVEMEGLGGGGGEIIRVWEKDWICGGGESGTFFS